MNVLTGKALNYGRIEGSLKVNGLEDDLRCACVRACVRVLPLPPTTHNPFPPPLPFSCVLLSPKMGHRNTQPSTLNPQPSTQNSNYTSNMGFVPQEDVMLEELTVFENLFYAARLRLPHRPDGMWMKVYVCECVCMRERVCTRVHVRVCDNI